MLDYPSDFRPNIHSKKPLCGVLSVAILASVTLAEAEAACRKTMPAFRKRFTGTTYPEQIPEALALCGFSATWVNPNPMPNMRLFIDDYAKIDVLYFINLSGHFFTLRNGIIADQFLIGSLEQHDAYWEALDRRGRSGQYVKGYISRSK